MRCRRRRSASTRASRQELDRPGHQVLGDRVLGEARARGPQPGVGRVHRHLGLGQLRRGHVEGPVGVRAVADERLLVLPDLVTQALHQLPLVAQADADVASVEQVDAQGAALVRAVRGEHHLGRGEAHLESGPRDPEFVLQQDDVEARVPAMVGDHESRHVQTPVVPLRPCHHPGIGPGRGRVRDRRPSGAPGTHSVERTSVPGRYSMSRGRPARRTRSRAGAGLTPGLPPRRPGPPCR